MYPPLMYYAHRSPLSLSLAASLDLNFFLLPPPLRALTFSLSYSFTIALALVLALSLLSLSVLISFRVLDLSLSHPSVCVCVCLFLSLYASLSVVHHQMLDSLQCVSLVWQSVTARTCPCSFTLVCYHFLSTCYFTLECNRCSFG